MAVPCLYTIKTNKTKITIPETGIVRSCKRFYAKVEFFPLLCGKLRK